jgi:hypothetical protein
MASEGGSWTSDTVLVTPVGSSLGPDTPGRPKRSAAKRGRQFQFPSSGVAGGVGEDPHQAPAQSNPTGVEWVTACSPRPNVWYGVLSVDDQRDRGESIAAASSAL